MWPPNTHHPCLPPPQSPSPSSPPKAALAERNLVVQKPLSAEALNKVPCGDLHPVPGQVKPHVYAPHDEVEVMGDSPLVKLRQPVMITLWIPVYKIVLCISFKHDSEL